LVSVKPGASNVPVGIDVVDILREKPTVAATAGSVSKDSAAAKAPAR
jgi:hypothetical protein